VLFKRQQGVGTHGVLIIAVKNRNAFGHHLCHKILSIRRKQSAVNPIVFHESEKFVCSKIDKILALWSVLGHKFMRLIDRG